MRIKSVIFRDPIALGGGKARGAYRIADTQKDAADFEVDVIDEHFPWVLVRNTRSGAAGITSIFNIVSRAVEEIDIERLTAPAPDAPEPAPQAKRRS